LNAEGQRQRRRGMNFRTGIGGDLNGKFRYADEIGWEFQILAKLRCKMSGMDRCCMGQWGGVSGDLWKGDGASENFILVSSERLRYQMWISRSCRERSASGLIWFWNSWNNRRTLLVNTLDNHGTFHIIFI
jgi:hypothetical protein